MLTLIAHHCNTHYNTHAVLPNTTATNIAKEPATVQLSQAATATPLDEGAIASGHPGDTSEISRQPKHEVQLNPIATTATEAVTVQLSQATTAMLPEKVAVTSENTIETEQLSRQPNFSHYRWWTLCDTQKEAVSSNYIVYFTIDRHAYTCFHHHLIVHNGCRYESIGCLMAKRTN